MTKSEKKKLYESRSSALAGNELFPGLDSLVSRDEEIKREARLKIKDLDRKDPETKDLDLEDPEVRFGLEDLAPIVTSSTGPRTSHTYIPSFAETAGIRNAKIKHRQRKKFNERRSFKKADRLREMQRKGIAKELKASKAEIVKADQKWKQDNKAFRNKLIAEKAKPKKFSKAERQEFRAMKKRQKEAKRERHRANRLETIRKRKAKIVTETGAFSDSTGSEVCYYEFEEEENFFELVEEKKDVPPEKPNTIRIEPKHIYNPIDTSHLKGYEYDSIYGDGFNTPLVKQVHLETPDFFTRACNSAGEVPSFISKLKDSFIKKSPDVWKAIQANQDALLFFTQIASYAMGMYYSQSAAVDMSLSMGYLSACTDASMETICGLGSLAAIATMVRRRRVIQTEAASDHAFDMASWATAIFDSQISMAITGLVVSGISLRLIPDDKIQPFMKYLKLPLKKMGLADLLETIFNSIGTLLQVAERLAAGEKWSELLMATDPDKEAHFRAAALLKFSGNVYTGVPVENKMCVNEYMRKSMVLIEYFKSRLKRINPATSRYMRMQKVLVELSIPYNKYKNEMDGGARVMPIGVVIHGDPGVGKSSVLNIVYQTFSAAKGRSYAGSHVFERLPNTDFWDGYDPVSTPIVHYSEVGSTAAGIVRSRGEGVLQELTSVIDSAAYMCNMSDVADKGSIYCRPELVAIDTNNAELNLGYTVNNPAAYKRRFIFVEVSVRPEYRKDGTSALDPEKTVEGEGYFDKWFFTVYRMDPLTVKDSRRVVIADKVRKSDFVRIMFKEFTSFMVKQDENKAKNRDISVAEDLAQCDIGAYSASETKEDDMGNEVEVSLPKTEAGEIFDPRIPLENYALAAWQTLCLLAVLACSMFSQMMHAFGILVLGFWRLHQRTRILVGVPFVFLFWYFSLFQYLLVAFALATLGYDVPALASRRLDAVFHENLSRLAHQNGSSVAQAWEIIDFVRGVRVGYGNLKKHARKHFPLISSLVGLGAVSVMVLRYFRPLVRSEGKEVETTSSTPVTKARAAVVSVEEKYSCSQPYKRINVKGNQLWSNQMVVPSVHKNGLEGLSLRVSRNVRKCTVILEGRKMTTFCIGVCKDLALINIHVFGKFKDFVLQVCSKGGKDANKNSYHETKGAVSSILRLGKHSDIGMLQLSGISFVDIVHHFPVDKVKFKAKGLIWGDAVAVRSSKPITVSDTYIGDLHMRDVVSYKWADHAPGMCGTPVLAKRDSGSCIVGLHSAAAVNSSVSYATVVLRDEIRKAMVRFNKIAPVLTEALAISGSEPHPKSPIRYEELGIIEYYGCVRTPMMNQKSRLVKTKIAPALDEFFFHQFSHARESVYVKPLMKPTGSGAAFKSPYNLGLRKMAKNRKGLDPDICARTVQVIFDKLVSNLDEEKISLQPLKMEYAVNGSPADEFLRRIDMNKAAGYGTPGKKSKYATRHEENSVIYDELDAIVTDEVVRIIGEYEEGRMYGPVFIATLKDEPRTTAKVAKGATRLFYSTPFAFLVLQRMWLSPLYTLMVEHSRKFYTAVGINMHSDADKLFEMIRSFSPNIIEGDFGGYDQSMPFEVGRGVNTIVLKLLKHFGYSESQLTVAAGILSDLLFPRLDFVGEMLCVPGLQPSGKYATAEDNSLRNLFIQVYAWIAITGNDDFFENCLTVTYGDDVLTSVKKEQKDVFNAITFSEFLEENTSLTFTTADKKRFVHPYISPEEMSFLKRNFVYHEMTGKIVAPLALDSIYKMLEWRIPSKVLNTEMQIAAICSSALWEMYFHCESLSQFAQCRSFLSQFCDEEDLPTLTTIRDTILKRKKQPVEMIVREEEQLLVHTESGESSAWDEPLDDSNVEYFAFGRAYSPTEWPAKNFMIEEQIAQLEAEIKEESAELSSLAEPMPGLSYSDIRRISHYSSDPEFRRYTDSYYALYNKVAAKKASVRRLWEFLQYDKRSRVIRTESAQVGEMSTGVGDEKTMTDHENVREIGGSTPKHATAGNSETINVGQKGLLDISNFLSRPVSLGSYSLAIDSDVTLIMDVWSMFLSNPAVRAKLRNFAYLKGDMHVRISVSGSPFHYGKLLLSYQPYASVNVNMKYHEAQLTGVGRFQSLSYLSQAPGAKVLDVKNNEPLEMHFPFICQQPLIRLFNDSPLILPDTSDFNDTLDLGRLYITSINPVKSAAPAPTSVSMFVYAWMDNVQMGTSTGTVLSVRTESGVVDERVVGPVEGTATRLLSVSEALSSVPVIEPYARASSMILRGVRAFAAIFGFSVPVMNNEPVRVRPQAYQNGANVIGFDTGKRIVLDPKQELTIDPRIVGVDTDDMAFSAIYTRPCLVDTFQWQSSDLPLTSSIWMAPVNPSISKRVSIAPLRYVIQPTPMGMIADTMRFWRGDIEFSFEIVCSKYHRGKLAFYIEPNIAQNVIIDTVLDMNKQYVQVVDIQETQHVTFTVPWMFRRAWARCMPPNLLGDLGTVSFLGEDLAEYANGYVAVTPFTALQSPDGSPIEVNVYVRSANMHFNQVDETNIPMQRPSAAVTESGTLSDEPTTHLMLNESTADLKGLSEFHFGEQPVSFRSLIKRFGGDQPDIEMIAPSFGTNDLYVICGQMPNFPRHAAEFDGNPSARYRNLLGYLRSAYLAMRGGIRHRYTVFGNYAPGPAGCVRVNLEYPLGEQRPPVTLTQGTGALFRMPSRLIGTVSFVPNTNGGIEFETPMYTNNLFGLAFAEDPFPATVSSCDPLVSRTHQVLLSRKANSTGLDTAIVHDRAGAEDFGFYRFNGAAPYIFEE